MLSVLLATVLTSGLLSRPTKADFLNTLVGCVIGVGGCGMPVQPTIPGSNNGEGQGDQTPPVTADPGTPTGGDTTPPADATPPVIDVLSTNRNLAGGNLENRTVVITGHVTDSDLVSCQLLINGVDVGATCNQNTDHTAYDLSYTWVVAGDPDNKAASGAYDITLVAKDAKDQGISKTTTITVDNDAPTVSVTGGGIIKSGSISPTVTASDANEPLSYSWTASSSNPSVLDYTASDEEPTFTPKVEGTYVFDLQVSDILGNTSDAQSFTFGYKQDLPVIPLPTSQSPTDGLVDQSPSTPAITSASTNPTIRSGRDEITTTDDAKVLGNTITAPGQDPPVTTVATIAPTSYGWSIFGLLWYWWLAIIGVFFAGWLVLKKFVLSRVPGQS